jgi:dTDP-glucose pyrophosphorylase
MDKSELESLQISITSTIKEAMLQMGIAQKRILFVVNADEVLIGTITDGDIRRGLLNGVQFSDRVDAIAHHQYVSVLSNTAGFKETVKGIMVENNIEQIPVLDEKGRVTDVIFWTDLIESGKTIQKDKYPNQVVIMAGGKGTRLDPFTKILPKPLIPIGNKPIIEIIMERFYQHGFHNFMYTLNYRKEYIKLFLKENIFPYTIDWVEESDYLGTAGGLSLLEGKVTDTFFVANCDSLLEVDFEKVLKWHREQKAAITIIGCHNEVKIPFGVLEISDGKLKRIKEKPVHDVLINTGVYVLEPHIISYIAQGKKVDMDKLIELVGEKEKVTVYPMYEGWFDLGQWEEYNKNVEKIEGRKIDKW